MLASVTSAAVVGIDAYLVRVEVDVTNGLPSFVTVGLPVGAVKEGRERVNSALSNAGFEFPLRRITVNLAPADVKKAGSAFDLPIALGLLAATEQLSNEDGNTLGANTLLVGELGLEGDLRPVRGILPMVLEARNRNLSRAVVPVDNLREASVVKGIEVLGASSLKEVVGFLSSGKGLTGIDRPIDRESIRYRVDFAEVKGQEHVKRALEVAAAGGHNVLLIGPPGSGKTMLARRMPTILPAMTLEEALETTKVHSVAGTLPPEASLITHRPFRAPHHTISDAGLVGGGSHPRPGEVSLAHNGVLFLDELPEFRRSVLEVLRQPLEERSVTISRAALSLSYPAAFMLVAAMNPCPCGHHGDQTYRCRCGEVQVDRYRSRISGPLLDRVDLHVHVPSVPVDDLMARPASETSEVIRGRVNDARQRQVSRLPPRAGLFCNAQMTAREITRYCHVASEAEEMLRVAIAKLHLSARAYHRVLKISRTLADLEGRELISRAHIAEAVQYRTLDRRQPFAA